MHPFIVYYNNDRENCKNTLWSQDFVRVICCQLWMTLKLYVLKKPFHISKIALLGRLWVSSKVVLVPKASWWVIKGHTALYSDNIAQSQPSFQCLIIILKFPPWTGHDLVPSRNLHLECWVLTVFLKYSEYLGMGARYAHLLFISSL